MIEAIHHNTYVNLLQPNAAELKAGKEFEAVMLTGFVEQILPKDIGGTETPQLSADIWRSFMARAIADQMASQNVTGVATLTAHQLMLVRQNSAANA